MRQKGLDQDRLLEITSKLHTVKALVVGDIILDHYIHGSAERLSPEAPVPVVWAKRQDYLLGGASNVSHNIAALGAQSYICGVVGKDFHGEKVKELLAIDGIKTDLVIIDPERPTTLKTRVLADHHQVVRLDWESTDFLSAVVNKDILETVEKNIDDIDVVIIEDYGKGVINPELIKELVKVCTEKGKIITVDPKEEHFDYYKGVTALTPNLKEACYAANFKVRNDEDLSVLGDKLLKMMEPEAMLVTLGEKGMQLFKQNGETFHLPTYAQEVFDVSGAGDTVIAVFSLALGTGASFQEAAAVANLAAGIVVGKLGCAVTNTHELAAKIEESFKG